MSLPSSLTVHCGGDGKSGECTNIVAIRIYDDDVRHILTSRASLQDMSFGKYLFCVYMLFSHHGVKSI